VNVLPTIIAIDPAASTGWAVGDYGAGASGLLAWGCHHLTTAGHVGWRFASLEDLVKETLRRFPQTVALAWERAFHRGAAATRYHHGYVAILSAIAARQVLVAIEIDNQQLKVIATGSGGADKAAMMRCAERQFGRVPATSDEADAWWIYYAARVQMQRGLSGRASA